MFARSVLELCHKSRDLPIGHVDRLKAEKAVDKIYEESRLIESKWLKRFHRTHRTWFNWNQAIELCYQICDTVGSKRLKTIVMNSADVLVYSGGHYNCGKKTIHLPESNCNIRILIHELTHHVELRDGHGPLFCWTEDFLFAIAYKIITGKDPKPHWSYYAEK